MIRRSQICNWTVLGLLLVALALAGLNMLVHWVPAPLCHEICEAMR